MYVCPTKCSIEEGSILPLIHQTHFTLLLYNHCSELRLEHGVPVHAEWINTPRFYFSGACLSQALEGLGVVHLFQVSYLKQKRGTKLQFWLESGNTVPDTGVRPAKCWWDNQRWQTFRRVKRKQEGLSLVPSEASGLPLWKQDVENLWL